MVTLPISIQPISAIARRLPLLLLIPLLAACGLFGAPPDQPLSVSTDGKEVVLSSPRSGAAQSNPIMLSGRITPRPADAALSYRLFGPAGNLLAEGGVLLADDPAGAATFAQLVTYRLAQAGPGRIELLYREAADAPPVTLLQLNVSLAANTEPVPPPTSTPPPSAAQPTQPPTLVASDLSIEIDTPPPLTNVGSPLVLTGSTSQPPINGRLSYLVRDATGATLGSGEFPVTPSADGSTFVAEITFALPKQDGQITVDVFEQTAGGPPGGSSIALLVTLPQTIVIDTPPAGATITSPLTISGRTSRFPFQGNLAYRFSDANGTLIGAGIFPVDGEPGAPTVFNPTLEFVPPEQGGRIRLEVYDQNAQDNAIIATTTIDLTIALPAQAITISSPPPNTLVGSPVVVTGSLVRPPFGGEIRYVVRETNGTLLGQGSFAAGGTAFSGALTFSLPPQGGAIVVELSANDSSPTQLPVTTSLRLNVNPATVPTAIATATAPILPQVVTIDSPLAGTLIGNPVVLTGRVQVQPSDGNLNYRVLRPDGSLIAAGFFPVNAANQRDDAIAWEVLLSFSIPADLEELIIEISDRPDRAELSDAEFAQLPNDTVQLRVNP